MTFNQTEFAHDAVIRGMFAEYKAKGISPIQTRGPNGMFAQFNKRLPQIAPGNQNVMGRLFHSRADKIASEFGYTVTFKQNDKRRSKKEYKLLGNGTER